MRIIVSNPHSHTLRIFGVSPSRVVAYAEFLTTYSTTIISAALGVTKCLKNGVARPIAPGGPLDGLLSGKFLLAFLASAGGLVARGACIGFAVVSHYQLSLSVKMLIYYITTSKNIYYQTYGGFEVSLDLDITMLLLFVPQFLLSLFSTLNFRDKSSIKILYRHSLIILPTVTFFTFSRLNIGCCGDDSRVRFSKIFTYINITVSIVGYVSWVVVWWYFIINFDQLIILIYLIIPTIPPLVLSILLTALFLHLDKLCCCCCNPREQLSVDDPDLDNRFIMLDGEVVEDPKDDAETAEDVETSTKTCSGCFNFTTV